MGDMNSKESVKTSVSKLTVRGKDEEVEAHTNNIVSVVDPKWSTRKGYLQFKSFQMVCYCSSHCPFIVTQLLFFTRHLPALFDSRICLQGGK